MNDHFGKTIDKTCSSQPMELINHQKIAYAYLAAIVQDTFIFLFIKWQIIFLFEKEHKKEMY